VILAGSCRLPVNTIVRIIMPISREVFITARRREREKTRKTTRNILLPSSAGAMPARTPGVILVTFTA